jgi:chromosome segregation ATPase
VSNNLTREHTDLQAEASALRQLATELVRELRIARTDAYGADHAETADVLDLAASILDNRRAGQPLLEEVARLRAQLAELSRDIGEQNTTIGYQDAMLDAARRALGQIDRHVVGACESSFGGLPEPCEECGEMREIASQALAAIGKARSE